jgi:hypothetical protein
VNAEVTTMSDEERNEERPGRGRSSDRGAVDEVAADLGALVAAHPAGAVAVALGAGYVLGGGVFTRLTSRLLRLALRAGIQFAVLPVLEQELATLVGGGKSPGGDGRDRAEKAH